MQSALQSKYDTPQVSAMARRQPGVSGTILSIQLINPPFLSQIRDEDLPAKAREVAIAARDALPATSTYAHFQVVLTKQKGVFIRIGTRRVYVFEPKDLPPRLEQSAKAP